MNWIGGTRNRLNQQPPNTYGFGRGRGRGDIRRSYQGGVGRDGQPEFTEQRENKRRCHLIDFVKSNMPNGNLLALQLSHQMEIDKEFKVSAIQEPVDEEIDEQNYDVCSDVSISSSGLYSPLSSTSGMCSPALPTSKSEFDTPIPSTSGMCSPAPPTTNSGFVSPIPSTSVMCSPALPTSKSGFDSPIPSTSGMFSPALPNSKSGFDSPIPSTSGMCSIPSTSGMCSPAPPTGNSEFDSLIPSTSGMCSPAPSTTNSGFVSPIRATFGFLSPLLNNRNTSDDAESFHSKYFTPKSQALSEWNRSPSIASETTTLSSSPLDSVNMKRTPLSKSTSRTANTNDLTPMTTSFDRNLKSPTLSTTPYALFSQRSPRI